MSKDLFNSLLINLEFEKKQLIPHLEDMSYEEFKEYSGEWLVSGRQVWYAHGNMLNQDTIKIV